MYGLIGKTLAHSFSKKFFTEKFERENINNTYELFELPQIDLFEELIKEHNLEGLNVTIPYKQEVMKYLDEIDPTAKDIDAVNTIKIIKQTDGSIKLKGFNTDVIGFTDSMKPLLKQHHKHALILGTGGASKAVAYALGKLGIEYIFVSRTKTENNLTYSELNKETISKHSVIINCSPLGTYPNVNTVPDIPFEHITQKHLLYDLVYNPENTLFCQKGKEKGATVKNGMDMLIGQAIAAWKIWNE